jgi:hypothetical protein
VPGVAMQHVAFVRRHVRFSRNSGNDLLASRISGFDPNLTLPAVNYRVAKGLFVLDVGRSDSAGLAELTLWNIASCGSLQLQGDF